MAAADHEFDQIGRSRSLGAAPDIGAFEFDPDESFPSDVTLRVTNVLEDAGEMIVTVGLLSLPDAGEEVTVDAREAMLDYRAIKGTDFTFSPTTLTFTSDGEPLQRVEIPIFDNDIANPDKPLEVFIESTTGPVGDIHHPVLARIVNDERATISFAGVRTAAEDSGAFRLSLELDRAVEIPFRASVNAIGGSAKGNVDFEAIREDFNVTQAGPRTFEFEVPIIDDERIEPDESLFIDLTVSGDFIDNRLLIVSEETIRLTIDRDSVDGGDGDDMVTGGRQNDTLLGGEGNDTLGGVLSPGESGADLLNGGAGDDMLIANGGNDTANGGEGHDVLFGGSGNDQLNGGSGNDGIFSGSGRDTLSGGEGSDLINASVFFTDELDNVFRSEFVAAWASGESYADRITAARAVLIRHEERFIQWDESTGDANIFLADPGLDWLHVDSDLDDFTTDVGEQVFELE